MMGVERNRHLISYRSVKQLIWHYTVSNLINYAKRLRETAGIDQCERYRLSPHYSTAHIFDDSPKIKKIWSGNFDASIVQPRQHPEATVCFINETKHASRVACRNLDYILQSF